MSLKWGGIRGGASVERGKREAHPEMLSAPLAMHPNGLGGGAQAICFGARKRVSISSENPLSFRQVPRGLLDLVQTILWVSGHTLVSELP